MWKGPGPDPGGGSEAGPPPASSQELSDLKDQFEQQQVLIAQLKEMLRKNEQSNVTQEKVDEYMNTLSKRGRSKKQKKDDDNKKTVDIPASQKISLLRQQVEENKVKLAERGKSQKGIQDMVTQLKAQLDDSQQMMSQSPLNLSLQDTKLEYSENSSAQELHTILLTKEKRISDLLAKVQKLESNNLDLQENLKEKDSVIDARTKAITLMTENLSRKSKNSLDQLDETREQMRKMQEDFVAMETEMKARQMKLLDDLRQKNYEIAELQEVNESLEKRMSEFKESLNAEELPNEELEALRLKNSELMEMVNQKEAKIKDLEEELKHKSEDEEVQKLKKQLEDSNKNMIKVKAQHKSKLKELTKKIEAFKKVSDANAEIVKLESENGRLNQKIAELEEEKGSLQLKLVESDSAKGSDNAEQRNELESQIQVLQQQLEEKDKIILILEAEIARSKSEIATLSEKLNGQVTTEMTSIHYEEQMESLENEKRQLTIEKEEAAKGREQLSETIEQLKKEKQEMSAKLDHYIQENMELIDKLEKLSAEKVSSAESIEIVEGLTQQEKLELEAYQKNLDMVAGNLKCSEENLPQADLNESVNELTEETSELLQKIELFTVERREVMDKMEQLKQENVNLSLKIKEVENNRDVLVETYEQLQSEKEVLDAKIDTLEAENASLKERADQEQEKPNTELEIEVATVKQQLLEKLEELQTIQAQLEDRNQNINRLNNTIIDLNHTITDTETDNHNLQLKIKELEEERTKLDEMIAKNQEELETVTNAEWESRRLLESKDNEICKLVKERDNTESVIQDLQKSSRDKEEHFQKVITDLKNKYLTLSKQLDDNSTVPMQAKIEEMNIKNKEQLEKMKKIAANLKKKTQEYKELDEKLKTSLQQLQDLEGEVARLHQQLDEKNETERMLEEKNVELQNIITELRMKADKSNEVSLQQELLLTKENLGSVESSLRAKIQELEMIVETRESELNESRARVNKLEEGISFVEERRLSLERKANELGAELEEKSQTCEEITRSEDMLEQRMAALAAHDDAIQKKLEEAVVENQELSKQNEKLREKNQKMKKKILEMAEKFKGLEGQDKVVEELEGQNEAFKKQIHDLANELKVLQNEYDRLAEESRNDFDKVNSDWQVQFEEILTERSELLVKCEKFAEELKEIAEKELVFNDELVEYKMKLESSEAQIKSYEEEMQRLKQQEAEADHLRQLLQEKEERLAALVEEKVQLEQKLAEREVLLKQNAAEIEELKKIVNENEVERRNQGNNLASFFDNAPKVEHLSVDQQQELSSARARIEELERRIRELEPATAEVVPDQSIPTFVWSGQTNDPFDFIQPTKVTPQEAIQETVQQPPQNTYQELLDKIKTLQFMLFNTEKEKEDTLAQCQELTNELTRLIYEKQLPQPTQDLESQIVQKTDLRDTSDSCRQLREIEFERTKPAVVSQQAVVEDVIQPKQAYLCYGDDTEPQVSVQSVPTSSAVFGENDDGWGWGPEEGKLEEEHAHKEDLEELKNKIRVFEMERENHLEEIRNLQVKSGKLIKKLKEMKAKNEELSQRKKSEGDMFNLDDAIQEELKLQIQQVEKKLKETSTELEKEKTEKATILKRIDVLTAANERMVEMKEKQDIELLGWQQNCRDLNAKLERLEWGDDGFSSADKPVLEPTHSGKGEDVEALTKKIAELNDTINELSLDNEELQALLEEQRKLRIEADKSLVQPKEEFNQLEKDRESLNSQLLLTTEEKRQLQDEVNELIRKNSELTQQFQMVEKQNEELGILQSSKEEIIAQLNETLRRTEEEKVGVLTQLQEKDLQVRGTAEVQSTIETLRQQLQEVEGALSKTQEEKDRLLQELQAKDHQIDSLKTSIDSQASLAQEKEVLFNELQEKNVQINTLKESMDAQISALKEELEAQIKTAEALLAEKQTLTETIAVKDEEIVRLTAAMEQMTQEWTMRIDQRGADVAESWKLHLESRETEFGQVEELLKKEIYELEEKTNALVNENNELRKNVDAEIRNEVDRVAALQQQITDRQQYINDLSRSLQEKQSEVERLQGELDTTKKYLDDEKEFIVEVCKVAGAVKENLVEVCVGKEEEVKRLRKELEEIRGNLTALEEERSKSLDEIQQLKVTVEERNQALATANAQLQEIRNLKDYEHENIENLQQDLLEYQEINTRLGSQLQTKNSQLEEKEREVNGLRQALEEKEREHAYALDNLQQEYRASITEQSQEIESLKRRLIETGNHYEELLERKESDLEGLRFELGNHMQGKDQEVEGLAAQLQAKIEECAALETRVQEQTALIDEEQKQLTELRAIIEEQVLKIEQFKKELFEKSNDYDSLIAEMDISRSSVKSEETSRAKEDEDLTRSGAELDLALYMLHQRDVRCEELTVELTQLLEERDTLQLRLSNVIREKEELVRQMTKDVGGAEGASSGAEVAVEALDPLTTKLSELKSVSYKKDKTLVDEQELRRFQQLSIMQQHRDDASRLPPEAAARLVDASYTLSRDVQSPSKVLLNWLWGRSTPRVNNI